MFTSLVQKFWSMRREFAKYFLIGLGSLALDMGTLIFFTEVFHLRAVVSVILNQAIVLSINFTLNKYWAFRNKAMPHRQVVRYLALAVWNYSFSVGAMYVFHDQLGFDYKLVRVASIALMVSWNFLLYKYWVYADKAYKADEAYNAYEAGKSPHNQ